MLMLKGSIKITGSLSTREDCVLCCKELGIMVLYHNTI